MGFLRKVSCSDIQGESVHNVDPTTAMSVGATLAAAPAPDCSRSGKKRKRDDTKLLTYSVEAALNEISDDSDVSSDEEKSPQEEQKPLSRDLKQKRRKWKGHRRTVAFGDLASTTRYYASSLTKGDLKDLKKNLWCTKQDRLKSQAECLETLKVFRIQNAEEVTRFSAVYRTSMQVPFSQESSDYLEKATVSVPLTIRGMEWGIAPKLKKRRREHIRSVLALQNSITDLQLRERFVSSRSLQSSRPARIMARIIGEGDASTSKMGTTSTALNVTTVPMPKRKKKATTDKPETATTTKRPLQEQQQKSHQETIPSANTTSCGFATTKKTTKMGQARRRRRPVLWRKVM